MKVEKNWNANKDRCMQRKIGGKNMKQSEK